MIKHFGWRNGADKGRIAVILPDEHGDIVGFRRLAGQAPSVGLLRHIVAAMDPDGSFFAKGIALCTTRVQSFAVERRTGMSGVRDYKLRTMKDPTWNDAPIAEQLHVSCEHKFNEFVGPMWLGDFVILVAAVLADYHQVDDESVDIWEAKIPELDWLTSSQIEPFFARALELELMLREERALTDMVKSDRLAVAQLEAEKNQRQANLDDEDWEEALRAVSERTRIQLVNQEALDNLRCRYEILKEAQVPHTWEVDDSQRTFDPEDNA